MTIQNADDKIENEVKIMQKKSVDRRTLKTKKAIRQAFAELLQEKELHKITVQEIADKADISRFTFYKYYLDVYDLYEKIEREMLIQISIIILHLEDKSSEEFFNKMVEYIDENRVTFAMIFNPNSRSRLNDKLSQLIEGMFRKVYSDKLGIEMDNQELVYICCYRSQGCIAVIRNWIMDGFVEPREYIVKSLSQLDENTERYFSEKIKK